MPQVMVSKHIAHGIAGQAQQHRPLQVLLQAWLYLRTIWLFPANPVVSAVGNYYTPHRAQPRKKTHLSLSFSTAGADSEL